MAEKKRIKIDVRGKVACLVDEEQFLVCGNNDYEVVFDFDGDWDGISAKTAVFVYGDTPIHQPFVGNICEGVEIKNATLCAIGVFAGDIKTSTGAVIECKPSIRDLGGVPKPPSKEVYDEIMELLDKAISGGGGSVDLTEIEKKIEGKADRTELTEGLATKVDKIKTPKAFYATNTSGGATYKVWSGGADANTVPIRSANGTIKTKTPIDNDDATNKQFVENIVNPLSEKQSKIEERVTNLENLTLDYPEDSTVAYEKIVPANVGNPAFIDMVGGASEVVRSKNLVNPNDIELIYLGGDVDVNPTPVPFIVNSDGSITFTVKYLSGLGARIRISMPEGYKYYYLVEDDGYGNGGAPYQDQLLIDYYLPEGEQYENWYADENTYNVKVMVYQGEAIEGIEYVDAPEGTVFEPYHEPYLVNADVERIESLGKNLINIDNIILGSFNSTGEFALGNHVCRTETPITVMSGATYTVSCNASYDLRYLYFYDNNNKYISNMWMARPQKHYYTFTVPTGASLVNIGFEIDGATSGTTADLSAVKTNCELQLELGANATDYKPYRGLIDTIVIPEAVKLKAVNDTCFDYFEFVDDKWLLHRNVGEVDLGSLTWTIANSVNEAHKRYIADFSQVKAPVSDGTIANILCAKYTSKSSADVYLANDGIAISTSGKVCIYDSLLTLSNFTSAIQGVKMYYELATPEVEDITHLFTNGNKIYIERGGVLRFVNEHEMPIPSTVGYVTRKE